MYMSFVSDLSPEERVNNLIVFFCVQFSYFYFFSITPARASST